MSIVFVDTKPKSQKEKSIQINEDVKVVKNQYSVTIFQNIEMTHSITGKTKTVESQVTISMNLFNEISERIETNFNVFQAEEEVLVPVSQKVIQADFSNKTFQKAFKIEKVTETKREEFVLNSNYQSVHFQQNADGVPCIVIQEGIGGVALTNATFLKIVSKVRNEESKPKGKVLSFKKAS